MAAAMSPAVAKRTAKPKRESQTVFDVLTAEDAGKFPYKNVADALQGVSCVSISREFSEGERVSLRSLNGCVRELIASRVTS
jgi:outer membrane receptor for ferrienterochelin and colicin